MSKATLVTSVGNIAASKLLETVLSLLTAPVEASDEVGAFVGAPNSANGDGVGAGM